MSQHLLIIRLAGEPTLPPAPNVYVVTPVTQVGNRASGKAQDGEEKGSFCHEVDLQLRVHPRPVPCVLPIVLGSSSSYRRAIMNELGWPVSSHVFHGGRRQGSVGVACVILLGCWRRIRDYIDLRT